MLIQTWRQPRPPSCLDHRQSGEAKASRLRGPGYHDTEISQSPIAAFLIQRCRAQRAPGRIGKFYREAVPPLIRTVWGNASLDAGIRDMGVLRRIRILAVKASRGSGSLRK